MSPRMGWCRRREAFPGTPLDVRGSSRRAVKKTHDNGGSCDKTTGEESKALAGRLTGGDPGSTMAGPDFLVGGWMGGHPAPGGKLGQASCWYWWRTPNPPSFIGGIGTSPDGIFARIRGNLMAFSTSPSCGQRFPVKDQTRRKHLTAATTALIPLSPPALSRRAHAGCSLTVGRLPRPGASSLGGRRGER
jgi:hypothetical protein